MYSSGDIGNLKQLLIVPNGINNDRFPFVIHNNTPINVFIPDHTHAKALSLAQVMLEDVKEN